MLGKKSYNNFLGIICHQYSLYSVVFCNLKLLPIFLHDYWEHSDRDSTSTDFNESFDDDHRVNIIRILFSGAVVIEFDSKRH